MVVLNLVRVVRFGLMCETTRGGAKVPVNDDVEFLLEKKKSRLD